MTGFVSQWCDAVSCRVCHRSFLRPRNAAEVVDGVEGNQARPPPVLNLRCLFEQERLTSLAKGHRILGAQGVIFQILPPDRTCCRTAPYSNPKCHICSLVLGFPSPKHHQMSQNRQRRVTGMTLGECGRRGPQQYSPICGIWGMPTEDGMGGRGGREVLLAGPCWPYQAF